ncbi:hypothetical protein DRQ09_01455 [candidate division KSB1 bacterium]|nr:MAG: hypothetical protein DRQ09_01455 [candidate division KSB1 bacterium]
MKKFKSTIILGIILVVLVVYAYVFEFLGGKKKQEAEEAAKKVFHFNKIDVEEIYIKRQEKENPEILFKKITGIWWLKKPLNYKADKSFIDGLLSNFEVAEIKRTIKDTTDLKKFGLNPPQAIYIIKHKDGVDTLYIGNKNPVGNYTFAMKPARDRVFLTYNAMLDKSKSTIFEYRDKSVLEFESSRINRIYLKAPRRNFELVKASVDSWELKKPVSSKADKSEVDKILNKVKNTKVRKFVEEEPKSLRKYALNRPFIKLELIQSPNDAKKTLFIGKKKNGNYYAKDDSRKPVFLVDSTLVNRLMVNLFTLRDKTVIDSKRKDIDKIELVYPDTTIVCEKDTANNWKIITPKEGRGKSWKINGIISDLEYLRVEKFLRYRKSRKKSYGLDKPAIEVVFSVKDSVIEKILLGKKVKIKDKEQRYFYNSTRGKLYLVKNSIYNDLKFHVNDLIEEQVKEEGKKEK